jgi:hypothetical protein
MAGLINLKLLTDFFNKIGHELTFPIRAQANVLCGWRDRLIELLTRALGDEAGPSDGGRLARSCLG